MKAVRRVAPKAARGPWLLSALLVACALVGLVQARAATMTGPGAGIPPGTTSTTGYGPRRAQSAVYPRQEIPLRFDHSRHLAKGMQCTQCHVDAERSQKSSDRLLPAASSCDGCHSSQHPPPFEAAPDEDACSMCHAGANDLARRITASVRMPPARLRFSHAQHVGSGSGVEAPCERCHGDMSKVRLATELQLPDEASCLECHDGEKASDRCGACHPNGPDGKLLTRPFDDMLAPPLMPRADNHWRGAAHDLAFVQDHKAVANANPQLCASCHEEENCLDCHAGVMRPMRIHAADYLTRHGVEARMGTNSCQSCHRLQDDCRTCHERTGLGSVGPESDFGVGSGASFHPSGWSTPGSLENHAFAAQRNIAACASCHSEDSCLACHATAGGVRPGLGVNPHGGGFEGSVRCSSLASRNRRVCLQCHAPGSPQLDCRL